MSITKKPITQIRLLLPIEMVQELDAIAKSREITRLALIRFLLRHQIDQELDQLEIFLEEREKRKDTCFRLQEHLSERER